MRIPNVAPATAHCNHRPFSISTPPPHSHPLATRFSLPNLSLLPNFLILQCQKRRRIEIKAKKEKKEGMAMVSVVCIASLMSSLMWMVEARIPGVYNGGSWQSAHATFYGGSDASGTMGMYHVLCMLCTMFNLIFIF